MVATFLDTGALSLVVDRPGRNPDVVAAQNWFADLLEAGITIYVPEICDYELRRELIRAQKTSSLRRLDILISSVEFIKITTPVMQHAAQLWATARSSGKPTADDTALDGDIILCAQVLSLGIPFTDYAVATTNVKHLKLFVHAAEWRDISV